MQVKRAVKELLWGASNRFLIQFIRYTFVGGMAFSVDYSLLYGLTEFFHFHYLTSATISFLAGLVTNYILSRYWVFHESRFRNKWTEFGLFALVGLVGLALNNGIIWLITHKLGLFYMYSKLLATVAVYLWNFLVRKYLVFKS